MVVIVPQSKLLEAIVSYAYSSSFKSMFMFIIVSKFLVNIGAVLYPSSIQEWEPVECIIGLIYVVHAHIGQLQYEGRSHRSLADVGIFFYDHFYQLDRNHRAGSLIYMPLEGDWNYIDWPVPDYFALESVKSKLFKDVQRSLRPSVPTKLVKLVLFIPITMFIELFGSQSIRIARTMLLCNGLDAVFCSSLLDNAWHTKESTGIVSEVALDSIIVKYMIATQSLILSFWYKRSRLIDGALVPMDQEAASLEGNSVMHIEVIDNDENLLTAITIRELSTLSQLRQDIMQESLAEIDPNFSFIHDGRKLLRRREKVIQCRDILDKVKIVQS